MTLLDPFADAETQAVQRERRQQRCQTRLDVSGLALLLSPVIAWTSVVFCEPLWEAQYDAMSFVAVALPVLLVSMQVHAQLNGRELRLPAPKLRRPRRFALVGSLLWLVTLSVCLQSSPYG